MKVRRRHDHVCVHAQLLAAIVVVDARCTRAHFAVGRIHARADARNGRTRDDLDPFGPSEGFDRLNDAVETALRVEHAVLKVEIAHQVIHARGNERR